MTYPEFLTKPAEPPPLMTLSGFLSTLYCFGGVSAGIYGMGRLVLTPMIASLTDARVELHATAAQNLARLNEKLEGVVSEIPPHARKPEKPEGQDDDNSSSCDDPAELFHRDVGVQTSPANDFLISSGLDRGLSSPLPTSSADQAKAMAPLVASVKSFADTLATQSSAYAEVHAVLDAFTDELELLRDQAYKGEFLSSKEPDDQVKKVKDNIRRAKGLLLSARSFPALVRS